jgi:hypothetical protein
MRQVVYKTNADYEKSSESLLSNPLFATHITEKGLLWFKFKETQTKFTLSKEGKMQVTWKTDEEKKILLKLVRNILVPSAGLKLNIKPEKQQAWINYDEPTALSWCEETVQYDRKTLGRALVPTRQMFDLLNYYDTLARLGSPAAKQLKEGLIENLRFLPQDKTAEKRQ